MRTNLIIERKNKNLTQYETATLLEVTERHYQALEAGTSKGSVDFWERAKKFFNAKSIDYLLAQSDEKVPVNI